MVLLRLGHAGTGVHDFNLILLIRKLRVGSTAILVCGSLRCLSGLLPSLRTVNVISLITVYKFSSEAT